MKSIKITLDDKRTKAFEQSRGFEPLSDVVQKAVEILNPDWKPSDGRCCFDARWIAQMAVRAVSEAIVRNQCMPMPLRVELNFAEKCTVFGSENDPPSAESSKTRLAQPTLIDDSEQNCIEDLPVPNGFKDAADGIGLQPERLAYLLCWAATRYPLLARFMLRFEN